MKDNKVFKVSKIVGLTIFYIIIAFLFLFSVSTLARKSNDQVPNLFGLGYLAVESDSMAGDNKNSFDKGDLIFVKVLSKKDQDDLDITTLYNATDPNKSKIVTFYDRQINALNTHRVVGVDGNRLITQGDNADEADSIRITANDVVGVYSGKISNVGSVISFMLTPLGFGLIVVLPFVLLLIYNGIMIAKNVFKAREDKLREELKRELAKEKEE